MFFVDVLVAVAVARFIFWRSFADPHEIFTQCVEMRVRMVEVVN